MAGLAHQPVEQIVLCESHLQHPGFQSREIANAGLKRPMDTNPSNHRVRKSDQVYRLAVPKLGESLGVYRCALLRRLSSNWWIKTASCEDNEV